MPQPLATASPAPTARPALFGVSVTRAERGSLAQSRHLIPTADCTMQSGQIGLPQFEQRTHVSTRGWFAQGTAPEPTSVPAPPDTRPSVASARGRSRGEGRQVTRGFSGLLRLATEVWQALIRSQPVVARDTLVMAHGLPSQDALETLLESQRRIREAGAVPATVAVIESSVRVGLTDEELARLADP